MHGCDGRGRNGKDRLVQVRFTTMVGTRIRYAVSDGSAEGVILLTSPCPRACTRSRRSGRCSRRASGSWPSTSRASVGPSGATTSCRLRRWATSSRGRSSVRAGPSVRGRPEHRDVGGALRGRLTSDAGAAWWAAAEPPCRSSWRARWKSGCSRARAGRADRRGHRRQRRDRPRDVRWARAEEPTSSSPPQPRAPRPGCPRARARSTFDAGEFEGLEGFFEDLPTPVDHVMVTGGGPYYAPLAELDFAKARRSIDDHLWMNCTSPSAGCGPGARCCSWGAPAAGGPRPAAWSQR
jgi:hypothetical protein